MRLTADWNALGAAIAGEVVLPGSPDYDVARKPAIVNFHDVRPRAVVRCRNASDVAEAIAFAADAELPTATRSGGHCFAGRSSTDGLVIDVTPMQSVSISGGLATVGAGTRLGPLYDVLDRHGLAVPAGCGPDVGIAGLTLGGGFGILGRRYGLTADHLVAAEVVLADGRIVECDEHHHEDLFWALRGAGGCRFGVVTSLVLRTVEAPEITTFTLVWSHAHAMPVIEAWQEWAPAAPDELAASLLVTAAGDADQPPKVTVFGGMLGSESDAAALLAELVERARAEPLSTSFSQLPYREAKRRLSEQGPHEEAAGHIHSKSEYFRRSLPADALGALVKRFGEGRRPSEARVLDFTPWGGAYTRVPADATAFAHRDARFLLKHEVVAQPDAADAARDWLTRSWATVHPWGSGGVYANFPDPDLDDWSPAYHGGNLDRLRQIKSRYDPADVLGSGPRPHGAPPAAMSGR